MISKASILSLSAAFLITFNGCGSSKNSNTSSSPIVESKETIKIAGSIVDGYLAYAQICLDLNLDGICQISSEPFNVSDEDGKYTLEIEDIYTQHINFHKAPLLVYGGYNIDTKRKFNGKLNTYFQDKENLYITPITTLKSALILKDKNIQEAESSIKQLLDLSSYITLNDNPLERKNIQLLLKSFELQKSIDLLAVTLHKANATVSTEDFTQQLYEEIAQQLAKTDIPFSLQSAIETIAGHHKEISNDVANSVIEMINKIESFNQNIAQIPSNATLETQINAMKKNIEDNVIFTHNSIDFSSVLEQDITLLHAQDILKSINYQGIKPDLLATKIATTLSTSDMNSLTFLSLQDEIEVLKDSYDVDVVHIAEDLEETLKNVKEETLQLKKLQIPLGDLTGVWQVTNDATPFAQIVVIANNGRYFYTQQALGLNGVIGGIEVGEYSFNHTKFQPKASLLNTNKEDTIDQKNITFNEENHQLTLTQNIEAKKIVATSTQKELGGWVSDMNQDMFSILIFEPSGKYLYSDINLKDKDMDMQNDRGRYNSVEFGNYILQENNLSIIVDEETDFNALCLKENDADCGLLAGDTNGRYGFSRVEDIEIEFISDNKIKVKFTKKDEKQTIQFYRIGS